MRFHHFVSQIDAPPLWSPKRTPSGVIDLPQIALAPNLHHRSSNSRFVRVKCVPLMASDGAYGAEEQSK